MANFVTKSGAFCNDKDLFEETCGKIGIPISNSKMMMKENWFKPESALGLSAVSRRRYIFRSVREWQYEMAAAVAWAGS